MPTEYDFGKYYLVLDKKLNRHIQSSDNPHKMTKAQLGLGNVENYSPADMPLSDKAKEEITRLDKRIDDISLYTDSYTSLTKVREYFYEASYNLLNYEYAFDYLSLTSDIVINWCSAFKVGKYFARNLDAYYNQFAGFLIKTSNLENRYATIGTTAGVEFLTNDFVDSRQANDIYKVLPFLILEGMNEKGVFAALQTTSRQTNPVVTVLPEEEPTAQYDAMMLVRYILDNFDNAEEAVNHIKTNVQINIPNYLLAKGHECQWIVGDSHKVFILSLDQHRMPLIVTEVTSNPIMTNFSYKNLHLGRYDGDELKVYTPVTQDLSKHWDASSHNQIIDYDFGLERYNKIVDIRRELAAKITFDFRDVQEELQKIFFTKAYTSDNILDAENFFFTDYVDSIVASFDPDNKLTVISEPEDFNSKITYYKDLFEHKERNENLVRQTFISTVYDLEKGRVYIQLDEDTTKTYSRNIVDNYQEQIDRITDELIPAETEARETADIQLQANIDSEASARRIADETEATARAQADQALQGEIQAETTRATGEESRIETKAESLVAAEKTRAEEAESQLSADLASETTRATIAEGELTTAISNETTRAEGAEASITQSLNAHKADKANPHEVTKAQVGLSDVINTSDSATPVENGVTKFTTGGAYNLKTTLEQADTTLQNNINTVDNKLDYKVHLESNSDEITYDGDTVTKTSPYRNLKTGTTGSRSENIHLANTTTAGLMSHNDYNTIVDLTDRVASLEGTSVRIAYSDSDTPTAAQIKAAAATYLASRGITDPTDSDYNGVSVRVTGTNHLWNYYANLQAYRDDGLDAVSTFTNSIAGIIKGAGETDGSVYAESDGTGSVYGWDALKTRVGNAETTLNSSLNTVSYDSTNKKLTKTTNVGTTTDIVSLNVLKTDMSLNNVDNTSDINKPISTATQTALDLKVDKTDSILRYNVSGDTEVISFIDSHLEIINKIIQLNYRQNPQDSGYTYLAQLWYNTYGAKYPCFRIYDVGTNRIYYGNNTQVFYFKEIFSNRYLQEFQNLQNKVDSLSSSVTDTQYASAKATKEYVDGKANLVETTWAALKDLRDNSQLIPGRFYRITDYECITTQANTSSAGHQFDIIVVADSTNKLNEKARAALHNGDTYFANSNLAAWQLWYDLDNDQSKYAWAFGIIEEHLNSNGESWYRAPQYDGTSKGNYCWSNGTSYYIFTDTLDASTTGSYYHRRSDGGWVKQIDSVNVQYVPATSVEGTGVIYRMIDEFNNDVPYDFKNILFTQSGKYTNAYTFSYTEGSAIKDASILGINESCYNNIMKKCILSNKQSLNFNVFYSTSTSFRCYNNTIANNSYNNTFSYNSYNNTIGNNSYNNTINNTFHDNTIGSDFYYNTILNNFNNNTIGNNFYHNNVGSDCNGNIIGSGCWSNTIGQAFYNNTIVNNFYHNTVGSFFYSNTIGNEFSYNTVGGYYYGNTVGNAFHDNTVGNAFHDNTIASRFNNNTIGGDFYYNTVLNNFNNNNIGSSASENVYVKYCMFDDGIQYTSLTSDDTSVTSTNYLQNVHIHSGVMGTSSAYKTITVNRNLAYTTDIYPIGSTEMFI